MSRTAGLVTIRHPRLKNPETFYRNPFVTGIVYKTFCSLCKKAIPELSLTWECYNNKNLVLCKKCWNEGTIVEEDEGIDE